MNQESLAAKQLGNDHKVASLDKALKSIKAHCSHEGLITELQQKIDKTKIEIEEYKADINKSKQLQQLTNELNSFNKANSA